MEVHNTLSMENEHQTPKTGAGDSTFANQQKQAHNQTVVLENVPHGKCTVEKASEAQGAVGFTELVQSETENKSECANTHSTHDTSVKDTAENSCPSNDESCKLVSQGEMSTTELLQTFATMHTNTLEELGKITSRLTLLEARHSEMAINQPVCENIVNATPVNHTQPQHNGRKVHHTDTSSNSDSKGDTDVDARYITRQSVGRDQQRSSSYSGC